MSNVTNFQTLLAFTMGHTPTKVHQILTSSFGDFVQMGTQTDRWRQKQYLLAACMQAKDSIHPFFIINSELNCLSLYKKTIVKFCMQNDIKCRTYITGETTVHVYVACTVCAAVTFSQ